jgi:hypothetical protein
VGNRSLAGWASLGLAFWRLDRMVKRVPIDEPWKADGARALDAQTLGGWFRSPWNVPSATERKVINTTMTTLFCVDLDEVSLLGSLARLRRRQLRVLHRLHHHRDPFGRRRNAGSGRSPGRHARRCAASVVAGSDDQADEKRRGARRNAALRKGATDNVALSLCRVADD